VLRDVRSTARQVWWSSNNLFLASFTR